MTFAAAWYFALLPFFLAVIAWWHLSRKRAAIRLRFPGVRAMQNRGTGLRAKLQHLVPMLFALAVCFWLFALARPQRADQRVRKNVEGIDIMLVLDVSDSMLIEDMQPNRLEAAKLLLKEFVSKRVSDRLGLVIFSGESYTRVPLTLDYPVLLQSIDTIRISRNIKMGTAIGVALANGTARLKDSTAKSRVMIFLTDGENNSGTIDPETALGIAKGYGLRIYTIGVGQDGDAQLPVESVDAFGRKVKRYQPIHSTVNDELLGKMAQETGGKYWRAVNNKDFKAVFEEIDRLERTSIEVNQYTKYTELFEDWVLAGLFAFISSCMLELLFFRRAFS